jgi:hypothetical protein
VCGKNKRFVIHNSEWLTLSWRWLGAAGLIAGFHLHSGSSCAHNHACRTTPRQSRAGPCWVQAGGWALKRNDKW